MQYNRRNDLIRAIIEKKLKEEQQKQQSQNSGNSIDRIDNISHKVENFGKGLSNTGSFLSNNVSSMGKIGNGMQTVGNALQKGAGTVQKVLPTSSNITNAIGTKIGSAIGSGTAGTTGATIGAGATTGAAAGTTAGTTAATSAGASAGAGAASGAAAGGSAGGGMGGSAAGGPWAWLIALAVMALQGTHRKNAKKMGQQDQKMAEAQIDVSKERLAQTRQMAEQIGNQGEMMQDNVMQNQNTIQDDFLSQYGGNPKDLIDSYIQSYLAEQSAQSPITNAIDSYVNTPVPNVNETDEQIKQGFFNKLANGLSDFLAGYKENRENGFDPNNLRPVENKGFMQRMGEGVGTAARMIHNPVAQGLVAGGLSTALTGNPLYGLGMANKFANNKMNSNLYQQILKNQGVNFDNYNGVITADDMSKILSANKYQRGFMTRKDYDRLRLENGLITVDEYNKSLSAPDYNPDEMVNISGLETVSKAGRNMQQNKNDKSANYYRTKNDGKNVIKVEYGEKPDSHNYTHVTYGAKPEQKSTTHITYGEKPQSHNNGGKKDNTPRIKVKSPDGKIGSIPASQLAEAIKKGYTKL